MLYPKTEQGIWIYCIITKNVSNLKIRIQATGKAADRISVPEYCPFISSVMALIRGHMLKGDHSRRGIPSIGALYYEILFLIAWCFNINEWCLSIDMYLTKSHQPLKSRDNKGRSGMWSSYHVICKYSGHLGRNHIWDTVSINAILPLDLTVHQNGLIWERIPAQYPL